MSSHNIIGVAGGTAAGKTTIVSKLYDHYGKNTCVIIGQDSYYKDHNNLNFKQRIMINYDHPNSIDIDLFHENLVSLKKGHDNAQLGKMTGFLKQAYNLPDSVELYKSLAELSTFGVYFNSS